MIEECQFEDVAHWRSPAARERTSVSPSRNTRWFLYGSRGCAGLMFIGKGARIKGVYVDKDSRGKGIGSALADFLVSLAASLGCQFIEAYAWNETFYLERGFELIGRNVHGAGRLRKILKKNDTFGRL